MENIITKSSSAAANEILVRMGKANGKPRATVDPGSWWSRLWHRFYAVRLTFEPPLVVQCSPAKLLNSASGDEIELRPRITIQRVSDDDVTTVAETFHDHYTEQAGYLKRLAGKLLQDLITDPSGGDPMVALFEPSRNMAWDYQIAARIRERTGLDVHVQLMTDDEAQGYIDRLRSEPARSLELQFRPLSTPRPSTIRLSYRVTGIAYRFWNVLCSRARQKQPPEDAMNRIGERIRHILDPVISGLEPKVLMNNHAGFWKHVETSFSEGVGMRIAEEFGCRIVITDLKRDKTSFETQMDATEDPDAMNRVKAKIQLIDDARAHRDEMLRACGFDMENDEVKRATKAIEHLDGELAMLKASLNKEKQLTAVRELPGADVLGILRDAADQARRTLRLPPAKGEQTQWLLDDEAGSRSATPQESAAS